MANPYYRLLTHAEWQACTQVIDQYGGHDRCTTLVDGVGWWIYVTRDAGQLDQLLRFVTDHPALSLKHSISTPEDLDTYLDECAALVRAGVPDEWAASWSQRVDDPP